MGGGRIASFALLLASANTWQVNAEDTGDNDVCRATGSCGAGGTQLLQAGFRKNIQKHTSGGTDDYYDDYDSDYETEVTPQCKDYTAQYEAYDDYQEFAAVDAENEGCASYTDVTHCGQQDDDDFIASEMCCNCGGGSTYAEPRSLAVNKARVFLSEGSQCPDDTLPIDTLTACRAALDMTGMSGGDYKGTQSENNWPKGCYLVPDQNGVWFNTHPQGGVDSSQGTRRFCQNGYDPKAVDIVFVGDSDIDFWDSAVAFPGSFNVGIGGYTTQDVYGEVDQWVADLDPQWVVLVCGENDIEAGNREATDNALTRFKTIVGKFIADGSRVIALGTKPEPGSKELYTEYEHYDEQIRKFAVELQEDESSMNHFQFIDVFNSDFNKTELFNSDELHMSRLGYTFWNAWVKLAMESTTPCILWRDGACVQDED